jgi:ssDNA-binding replication factor A large subunit
MLALPFVSFSQTWADDSSLEDILNSKSAFGDDETSIVVVEFWAKFNEANAFPDWDKLQDIQYVRVDIAKAAKAKKEYRVRMAPTLIIFKDGIAEESFKAGLDLECPVDLVELQEAIEEVKTASAF